MFHDDNDDNDDNDDDDVDDYDDDDDYVDNVLFFCSGMCSPSRKRINNLMIQHFKSNNNNQ